MSRRWLGIGCVALALLTAGCQGAGSNASLESDQAVTSDVRPIALSSLTGAAAEAMALCGVEEHKDLVTGAGEVLHARDLPKYVPLSGKEPEIQTDEPAYAVTFEGVIRLPVRGMPVPYIDQVNATCVVVRG